MYWTTVTHPWRDMDRMLRDLNLLLGDMAPTGASGAFPPVNAWASADGVVLTAQVPGVAPGNIQVTVEGNVITLRGQLPARERREGETYHRSERPTGEFVREFRLPFRLNPDQVKAALSQGVLEVTVSRLAEDKPRTITVQAA